MTDIERKVSVSSLHQRAKECASQGNYPLASDIRSAAEELTQLRSEVIRLKSTVREIRTIANLSIMRQI